MEYTDLDNAVKNYYSGEDKWASVTGVTTSNASTIFNNVSNINMMTSNNGKVLSYSKSVPFNISDSAISDAQNIDSSVSTESNGTLNIPAVTTIDSSGNYSFVSGVGKDSSGNIIKGLKTKSPLSEAITSILTMCGLVTTAPVSADSDLFSDTDDLKESLKDETDSEGNLENTIIYGNDSSGKSSFTSYYSKEAVKKILNYLIKSNYFDEGKFNAYSSKITEEYITVIPGVLDDSIFYQQIYANDKYFIPGLWTTPIKTITIEDEQSLTIPTVPSYGSGSGVKDSIFTFKKVSGDSPIYICIILGHYSGRYSLYFDVYSKSNFKVNITVSNSYDDKSTFTQTVVNKVYTSNEVTDDFNYYSYTFGAYYTNDSKITNSNLLDINTYSLWFVNANYCFDSEILILANSDLVNSQGHAGSKRGTDTTVLKPAVTDPKTDEDDEKNYQALVDQIKELNTTNITLQDDLKKTTLTNKEYVSATIPGIGTGAGVTSDFWVTGTTQGKKEIDEASEETLIEKFIDKLKQMLISIGIGSGNDVSSIITGHASSLYSAYSLDDSTVDTLGGWLWTDDFITAIKKLFGNPIDCILGMHKIACKPSGTSGSLKVGYITSNIAATRIDNQYETVDLGGVDITPEYNNFLDYDPYTKITVYLPFIGFVNVSTSDVMRGKIYLSYRFDVLTGAILVKLQCKRDNLYNTIATYGGNGSASLPVTSANYTQAVVSTIALATSVVKEGVTAVATEGSSIPASVAKLGAEAATSVANGNYNVPVTTSGTISGNCGMLGDKTPYVIITRPTVDNNYSSIIREYGKPTNYCTYSDNIIRDAECKINTDIYDSKRELVTISYKTNTSNYYEASNIQLYNSYLTDSENEEIKQILNNGFYS